MERDFSEASKQRLLGMVDEVENEKLCNFTDWVGDRWYDFEFWIGQLNIRNYLNNVNEYHKKVIDKNNISKENIEDIFTEVNAISDRYKVRFTALLSQLKSYKKLIQSLSDTVNPSNGKFNSESISNKLKNDIEDTLQANSILQKIATNGIDYDDIKNRDDSALEKALSNLISNYLDVIPNFNNSGYYEIPISEDLILYYRVDTNINTGSDIDLSVEIENNKLKFKNFNTSAELLGISIKGDTDGGVNFSGSDGQSSTSFNNKSVIQNGTKCNIDDNTTCSINLRCDNESIVFEETVKTSYDVGSISSTIGIKKDSSKDTYKTLPIQSAEADESLSISSATDAWWQTIKIYVNSVLPDNAVPKLNIKDFLPSGKGWESVAITSAAGTASAISITSIVPYLVLIPI